MSSVGAASCAAVPVSSARAEASRRNGARSRGPNTPEGKARSAQNALKHGLRAQKYVVLPEEDAAEFADLEAELIAELAPVGVLQTVLARRVAVAAWRLARADRIEVELFAERSWGPAPNPGLALIRDGNGTRSFETLLRYRGAAMAELWRALKTLKALQVEQAAAFGPTLATQPQRPAARASLVHRPQPDEPKRAAEPRLGYVSPAPPASGRALHEPAAPWTPKEPETRPGRHAASAPVSQRNAKPHSNSARPEGGESRPSLRLPGNQTNPRLVEVGAGPDGSRRPIASRRARSASPG